MSCMRTARLEILNHNVRTLRKPSHKSVKAFIFMLFKNEAQKGTLKTHARPSSLRMSMVTLFLLRARLRNQGLVPSTSNSRHTRSGSPLRGGSTLMISAPKCLHNQPPNLPHLSTRLARVKITTEEKPATHPSSWPANGPAMSCPSSRTRTPDSGKLLDLSFDDESVALLTTPPLPVMGT